jgi:pentatricopeptide repeat protein
MQKDGVKLNTMTCNILIRFYGKLSKMDKMNMVLESMKEESLPRDLYTNIQSVYSYVRVRDFGRAEECLNNAINICPKDSEEVERLFAVVQYMLQYFLEQMNKPNPTDSLLREIVEKVERIFHGIERQNFFGPNDQSKFFLWVVNYCPFQENLRVRYFRNYPLVFAADIQTCGYE